MNLRLCSLGPRLSFAQAKLLSSNFSDPITLPEHSTSIALCVVGPINKWRTDFLFDYNVFPAAIMRFDAEWKAEDRKMAMGDIILQRALMPPVGFGFCLEFAVRICAVISEDSRLGFAYETLIGHAESGISEFYFEEKNGELFFTIHTYSQPGHWTSRIGKRYFTLPYQAWCTRRAMAHVRRLFYDINHSKLAAAADEFR